MQYYTVLYNIIRRTPHAARTVLYSIIQYCTVLYSIIQCCTAHSAHRTAHSAQRNSIIQYYAVLYSIIQCYTVLYSIARRTPHAVRRTPHAAHTDTVLYSIIQYYTVLHSVIQCYTARSAHRTAHSARRTARGPLIQGVTRGAPHLSAWVGVGRAFVLGTAAGTPKGYLT